MPFHFFRNIGGVLRTLAGLKISGADIAPSTILPASIVPVASGMLLGRNGESAGEIEQIGVGIGLDLSGWTLNTAASQVCMSLLVINGDGEYSPVDGFYMYSEDSGVDNACPTFKTENGTVIVLNQDLSTTADPSFASLTAGYVSVAADGSITSNAGNNNVSGAVQLQLASRTPQMKFNVIRQNTGDAALSVAMMDVYATNLVSSVMLVRLGAYGSVVQTGAPAFSYAYFGQAFNDTIIRFYGNKNVTCDGNLGVGVTTFGTSATKTLCVGSGTAPTTSPADAFQMYSADQTAGNACPHIRTENGSIVKLFQQAAIADAAGGDEAAKINAILGVLRNAGLIAT